MNVSFISFALTLVSIPLLARLFRKLGWMDRPQDYGYRRAPVPYAMGILFFLVFALCVLIFLELNAELLVLLVSGAILTLVSFFDDRYKLPALPRLGIQVLCALAVVLSGVSVPALTNPFGDPIVLDGIRWTMELGGLQLTILPLASIVAVIWIVFVMNAMNWLDGVPGMVSGMSSIALMVIFLLASQAVLHEIDQTVLTSMALILLGSSVAFWLFDFPPPRILMGDSGTMFLGFMLGIMAIYSGAKFATAFIVLAFPLMDALWTISKRLLKKKSPFAGDFEHFHHELMKAGLGEAQVNLLYYLVSLSFGFIALGLQSTGKLIALLSVFGLMAVLRVGLALRRRSLRND